MTRKALHFAILAGLATGLAATAAAPAHAEFEQRERWYNDELPPVHRYPVYRRHYAPPVYYAPVVLPEHAVRANLRQAGFHTIGGLFFDGTYYRGRARDGWGRPVFIVASAQTGSPVEVRPIR